MFRRRTKPSFLKIIRETLWPKKGFYRIYSYLVRRILRMSGSPYSLACGFACGASVSFTPFIGFHLILGAVLAYLMRGNILASWIGTLVGNPWTFPFILVLINKVGVFITPFFGFDIFFSMNDNSGLYSFIITQLFPMALGGAIVSVFVWPIIFTICYFLIIGWRKHKIKRKGGKKIYEKY